MFGNKQAVVLVPLTEPPSVFPVRFLDILAARKDPVGLLGEVLIDGAPQPPNFKCLSGYVVQVREQNFTNTQKETC